MAVTKRVKFQRGVQMGQSFSRKMACLRLRLFSRTIKARLVRARNSNSEIIVLSLGEQKRRINFRELRVTRSRLISNGQRRRTKNDQGHGGEEQADETPAEGINYPGSESRGWTRVRVERNNSTLCRYYSPYVGSDIQQFLRPIPTPLCQFSFISFAFLRNIDSASTSLPLNWRNIFVKSANVRGRENSDAEFEDLRGVQKGRLYKINYKYKLFCMNIFRAKRNATVSLAT